MGSADLPNAELDALAARSSACLTAGTPRTLWGAGSARRNPSWLLLALTLGQEKEPSEAVPPWLWLCSDAAWADAALVAGPWAGPAVCAEVCTTYSSGICRGCFLGARGYKQLLLPGCSGHSLSGHALSQGVQQGGLGRLMAARAL